MHPSAAIRGKKGTRLLEKKIVLGVTGSIAAVETVRLVRELIRHGADVRVVMSDGAREILHPNALQFASGHEVIQHLDGSVPYITAFGAQGEADLLLIAPATANTVSKIAHGIDDTPVTTFATMALGSHKPVLIAPAMHEPMYEHPLVQKNVAILQRLGVVFVPPKVEEDKAKMADRDTIVAYVLRALGPQDMRKKKAVVIAGSTEEEIDDLRIVTNRSSGETGIELAKEAFYRGADVELWLGRATDPSPPYVPVRRFSTTRDLMALTKKVRADFFAVPAAISDYSPKRQTGKIPSRKGPLTIDLLPTPKVIRSLKRGKTKLVAFKAESRVSPKDLLAKAKSLFAEARADLVVANDVTEVKAGKTHAYLLDAQGHVREVRGTKALLAQEIWSGLLHGLG